MDLFSPQTLARLEIYGECQLVSATFAAFYPHVWRTFGKTRLDFATPDQVIFAS